MSIKGEEKVLVEGGFWFHVECGEKIVSNAFFDDGAKIYEKDDHIHLSASKEFHLKFIDKELVNQCVLIISSKIGNRVANVLLGNCNNQDNVKINPVSLKDPASFPK